MPFNPSLFPLLRQNGHDDVIVNVLNLMKDAHLFKEIGIATLYDMKQSIYVALDDAWNAALHLFADASKQADKSDPLYALSRKLYVASRRWDAEPRSLKDFREMLTEADAQDVSGTVYGPFWDRVNKLYDEQASIIGFYEQMKTLRLRDDIPTPSSRSAFYLNNLSCP